MKVNSRGPHSQVGYMYYTPNSGTMTTHEFSVHGGSQQIKQPQLTLQHKARVPAAHFFKSLNEKLIGSTE